MSWSITKYFILFLLFGFGAMTWAAEPVLASDDNRWIVSSLRNLAPIGLILLFSSRFMRTLWYWRLGFISNWVATLAKIGEQEHVLHFLPAGKKTNERLNRIIYNWRFVRTQWCKENQHLFQTHREATIDDYGVGRDYRQYLQFPIVHEHNMATALTGEQAIALKVRNYLKLKTSYHLNIWGEGTAGKTALAHQLVNYLQTYEKYRFICLIIDEASYGDAAPKLTSLVKEKVQKITGAYISEDFIEQLILNGNIVLLIDNADKILTSHAFSPQLELLYRPNSKALFITTSRENTFDYPLFGKVTSLAVSLLDYDNADKLGKSIIERLFKSASFEPSPKQKSAIDTQLASWRGSQLSTPKNNAAISPGYLEFVCEHLVSQIDESDPEGDSISLAHPAKLIESWINRLSLERSAAPNQLLTLKILGYLSVSDKLYNSPISVKNAAEYIHNHHKNIETEGTTLNIEYFSSLSKKYPLFEITDETNLHIKSDFQSEHLAAMYITDLIANNACWEEQFLYIAEQYNSYLNSDPSKTKSAKSNLFDKMASHLKEISNPTKFTDELIEFFAKIDRPIIPSGGRQVNLLVLCALSGSNAIRERSIYDAITLAIEEVNESEEFKRNYLRLHVPYPPDTGARNSIALSILARALKQSDRPIAGVFGCYLSSMREAIQRRIRDQHLNIWYPATYEGTDCIDNVVFLGAAPNQQIIPALTWLMNEMPLSSLGMVGSDFIFSHRAHDIAKRVTKEETVALYNYTYDLHEHVTAEQFERDIGELANKGVKWIFHTMNGRNNVNFFRALANFNESIKDTEKLQVMTVSIAESAIPHISPELLTGHYCCWNYFRCSDNSGFPEKLVDRYMGTVVADDPVASAYMSIKVFAKAVLAAKTLSPEDINKQISTLSSVDGPGGDWLIHNNNHFFKKPRIGRFTENGSISIECEYEKLPPDPTPFSV